MVKENPVAQRQVAVGRDSDIARVGLILEFFEVVLSKGIRGEEPVIAHMPPGGMPRVERVVEDGDAVGEAIKGLFKPVCGVHEYCSAPSACNCTELPKHKVSFLLTFILNGNLTPNDTESKATHPLSLTPFT